MLRESLPLWKKQALTFVWVDVWVLFSFPCGVGTASWSSTTGAQRRATSRGAWYPLALKPSYYFSQMFGAACPLGWNGTACISATKKSWSVNWLGQCRPMMPPLLKLTVPPPSLLLPLLQPPMLLRILMRMPLLSPLLLLLALAPLIKRHCTLQSSIFISLHIFFI